MLVVLSFVAYQATLDDAIVGNLKPDLVVVGPAAGDLCEEFFAFFRRLAAGDAPTTPVAVEPLEVEGVKGVLLALEPVAGEFEDGGFSDTVPGEDIPTREQRRGLRAHVAENDAAKLLYFVGLYLDLVLESAPCGL
jgi:hypothetical protein